MKNYAKYIVSFGLSVPNLVGAVGLGSLKVESSLNMPLTAYIRLNVQDGTPLTGIRVRLASPQAYQRAGLDRPYELSKIQFEITRLNGRPVIKLSSQVRMDEPYFSVLLDITWDKGQFYRAYSVLLDPPDYRLVKKKISRQTVKPRKYRAKSKPVIKSKRPSATDIVTHYGPTTSQDDLWKIALKYRSRQASVNQTMVAIVQMNPNKFVNGNVNGLKQGVRLKIPSEALILSHSRQQASAEVSAHMKAWRSKSAIEHVIDLSSPASTTNPPLSELPVSQESAEQISQQATIQEQAEMQQNNKQPVVVTTEESTPIAPEPSQEQDEQLEQKAQQTSEDVVEEQDGIQVSTRAESSTPAPLFDEFMPIPKVLSKIIKQPKSRKADTGAEQAAQSTTSSKPVADAEPTMKAEVAVAVSAIASVKESNQLLRDQVKQLIRQNEVLKQQLVKDSVKDKETQRKLALFMKLIEKEYVQTPAGNFVRRDSLGQESQANETGMSISDILALVNFLFFLSALGIGALWYFRADMFKKFGLKSLPDLSDKNADENSSEPPKEELKASRKIAKPVISQQVEEVEAKPEEAKAEKAEAEKAETEKAKAEKAKAEKAEAEKAEAEKAEAEKAEAEKAEAEKAEAEKAEAEKAKAEKAKAEKAKAEKAEAEKAEAEKAEAEKAKAEKAKAEKAKAEKAKAEKAEAEKAKAAKAEAEKAKAEKAEAEKAKAEKAEAEKAEAEKAEAEKTIADEPLITLEEQIETTDVKNTVEADTGKKSTKMLQSILNTEDSSETLEGEQESASVSTEEADEHTLEFDLSGIDLSKSKEEAKPKVQPATENTIEFDLSSDEPITKGVNMSTQLALAETYIAMEDWESAKTSLQEVLEGGTAKQIEKAQSLLKSIP